MRVLRDHQVLAIDMLRRSLSTGHKRPMLCLPTGAGKTLTAAHIIASALDKGKRITFTVPALSLVDQTVQAFWDEGIRDIGVMQADHAMTDCTRRVQVASVQTLSRRPKPDTDLVIVDEAHRVFEVIPKWMAESPAPFIGLSASPWTRGLGKLFDDLLIPTTTKALIAEGYLSPFRVYAPSHVDLSRVRTVAGDYREDDLAEAMTPLTADIVSTWLERGEGRPTLCFAVDRAHAKHLQRQFEAASVPTGYVDAFTDGLERERLRKAFHAGDLKVICNVGVLTTGVDWDVRCIILARPTKSEMLYVQIIGRGLRTADDKLDCLILDHSDTTQRLGFVTDIHHDALDDGKPKPKAQASERKPPEPKECSKCAYLRPAKVSICPACGRVAEHRGDVDTVDGELVEFDDRRRAQANKEASWDVKIAFAQQIARYARDTHKKPGWCAHKYKARFGVWPNDLRVRDAAPAGHADPAIYAWIRSQNIRFAKSKAMA